VAFSTGGSILVVDDDPAIRETIVDILELEGYPVVGAADGAQALTQVEQALPWLILLDMRMPIMDGWAFSQVLKERHLRVPVVVMTAARDARPWAQQIGAEDYLAKPFDIDQLVSKVREHFAGRVAR
jgi:CheY-like chemotaxis protein